MEERSIPFHDEHIMNLQTSSSPVTSAASFLSSLNQSINFPQKLSDTKEKVIFKKSSWYQNHLKVAEASVRSNSVRERFFVQ
jgi:hypothetical protein